MSRNNAPPPQLPYPTTLPHAQRQGDLLTSVALPQRVYEVP